MRSQKVHLSASSLLMIMLIPAAILIQVSSAFHVIHHHNQCCYKPNTAAAILKARALNESELEEMKEEIEMLKAEALQKIQELDLKVKEKLRVAKAQEKVKGSSNKTAMNNSSMTSSLSSSSEQVVLLRSNDNDDEGTNSIGISSPPRYSTTIQPKSSSTTAAATAKDPNLLLEDTDWRILLNVGREPGTWMPKTWGVSGERLLVNMEVIFSSEQLYEKEDFLGGVGGARVLQVLNDEITLGPSIQEGSKTFKVRGGGWRVVKGEGPMGSDIIRFYFECDKEIRHIGGDVYVPAGRIYCTCGYFPMNHARNWEKGNLEKQIDYLREKYQETSDRMNAEGAFSFNRIKLFRELVQLSTDIDTAKKQLEQARMRDPDMSQLHLSSRKDVGLTRQGAVVCKVVKPVGYEYHILGRFNINSREPGSKQQSSSNNRLSP